MSHPAWFRWKRGEAPSLEEAREVFRIDAYTVGRLETRKIARLAGMFVGDPELEAFLQAAARVINHSAGS